MTRSNQRIDSENPFVYGDWAVSYEGEGRLLYQLVMSLAGKNVVCHLHRLWEMEPERFYIALEMLRWVRLHGLDDHGLHRLAAGLERSETLDLFASGKG